MYAGEKDASKVDEMIARAKVDLKTLQMLSKWDSETWAFGVPDTKAREETPTGSERKPHL